MIPEGMHILPSNVPDLSSQLNDEHGQLKVVPAAFYKMQRPESAAVYCVRHGCYGLPTIELCEWLRDFIGERQAMEIGAGNGVMAAHLGIRAVDNFMQNDPRIRELYQLVQQPPVRYGNAVEKIEALDAVKKYRPQVVISCYVTHRYNAAEHWRGGNMFGPDTGEILKLVEHYIHIGNEKTHSRDPLMELPHEMHYFPWLHSRASMYGRDFIGVWKGER